MSCMFKDIYYKKFMFSVIFIAIISIMVMKFESIVSAFNLILKILTPFFIAFSIAYLFNPLMKFFENKFKLKRIYAILLIYFIALFGIFVAITMVSPTIARNVGQIFNDMPSYLQSTQDFVEQKIINSPMVQKYDRNAELEKNLNSFITNISEFVKIALDNVLNFVIGFTSVFLNAILGIIISIYMLKDKEDFINKTKNIIRAVFNTKHASMIILFGKEVNMMFSKFIIGKIIDSAIIGFICVVGLFILNIKYGLLIGIIVGITNMIPYFGPFIGAIPAVLITLFYDPIKALWVLLFIIGLQQFDGLILGPKILGDQVGLSPFWIILSIIFGGGTFGVIGMFLAVPIFAIIKLMIDRFVSKELKKKRIEKI